jgi:hypothetical protein
VSLVSTVQCSSTTDKESRHTSRQQRAADRAQSGQREESTQRQHALPRPALVCL